MEFVSSLLEDETTQRGVVLVVVPWLVLLLYAAYHYLFGFGAKKSNAAETTIQPFIHFFSTFTSGSTAGYDKDVFELLHPSLLQKVDKGIVRAMMRYLHSTLGPCSSVPKETVLVRQDGLQLNAVALVNFEKARNVKCQLHWVIRPSVAQGERNFDGSVRFHVMSFHVDVPPSKGDALTVVNFLQLDDFVSVGEQFVAGLFDSARRQEMVQLMLPSMRSAYEGEDNAKLAGLAMSMQKTLQAAGQLKGGEFDCTLVEASFIRGGRDKAGAEQGASGSAQGPVIMDQSKANAEVSKSAPLPSCSSADGELKGFSQTFYVPCNNRDIEVELRLTLVELSCYVFNFQVRLLPEKRQQVVIDRDTSGIQVM